MSTSRSTGGALLDQDNWALDDIERVEVVRGPGSVTHGPGAIAGVINIVTRRADDISGPGFGLKGDLTYRAAGGYVNASLGTETNNLYGFVGAMGRMGADELLTYETSHDMDAFGLWGKDFATDEEAVPYMGPPADLGPDMKVILGGRLFGAIDLNGYYTRSAMTWGQNSAEQTDSTDTWKANELYGQQQYFGFAADNQHHFSNALKLKTSLGYDVLHEFLTEQTEVGKEENEGIRRSPVDPGNVVYDYADHALWLRSVVSLTPIDMLSAAVGCNLELDMIRPSALYESDNWLDDGVVLQAEGRSVVIDGDTVLLEEKFADGFTVPTVSGLGEVFFRPWDFLTFLASGRLDYNPWSELLFSPRVGAVWQFRDVHALKLVWQKSNRMGLLQEMYEASLVDEKEGYEELSTLELLYTGAILSDLVVDASVYYNSSDVWGWSAKDSRIAALGRLDYAGLEAQLRYHYNRLEIGLSQSYLRMISWDAKNPDYKQGVSYSDYNVTVGYDSTTGDSIVLSSNGHSLSNVPTAITKLNADIPLPIDLSLATSLVIEWDMGGRKEVISIYEEAYGDNMDSAVGAALDYLEDAGLGGPQAIWNLGLNYRPTLKALDLGVCVYVNNLLGYSLYGYSTGLCTAFPDRVDYYRPPRTVGLKVDVGLQSRKGG